MLDKPKRIILQASLRRSAYGQNLVSYLVYPNGYQFYSAHFDLFTDP